MSERIPNFVVVGLGNVGARYQRTRHNIGFMALDRLAERFNLQFQPGRGDYYIASNLSQDQKKLSWFGRLFGSDAKREPTDSSVAVVLIKPTTLMNRSGRALRQILERYQLPVERALIITDDFQLPLGALRLRARGSSGGHNGLKSLISELESEDFPRMRLGIGPLPEKSEVVPFVLGEFTSGEASVLQQVTERAAEACEFMIRSSGPNSLDLAAAKYNIVRPDPAPGSGSEG
jgi:PTH1 family peptidyl-tRNA hydrolase